MPAMLCMPYELLETNAWKRSSLTIIAHEKNTRKDPISPISPLYPYTTPLVSNLLLCNHPTNQLKRLQIEKTTFTTENSGGQKVHLPRESHQRRIQRERQQEMRDSDRAHRQDSDEILDSPVVWDERPDGQDYYACKTEDTEEHGELELLQDLGDFDEEVGELGFLGGSTPGHVDLEHVRKEGLGDMQRETSQEDGEHEGPLDVLEERIKEGSFTDTITHDSKSQVTKAIEDDDDREPDLP